MTAAPVRSNNNNVLSPGIIRNSYSSPHQCVTVIRIFSVCPAECAFHSASADLPLTSHLHNTLFVHCSEATHNIRASIFLACSVLKILACLFIRVNARFRKPCRRSVRLPLRLSHRSPHRSGRRIPASVRHRRPRSSRRALLSAAA